MIAWRVPLMAAIIGIAGFFLASITIALLGLQHDSGMKNFIFLLGFGFVAFGGWVGYRWEIAAIRKKYGDER